MAEVKEENAMDETTQQTAEEVQAEEAETVQEADAGETEETADADQEVSGEAEGNDEASQKKGFFGKRKEKKDKKDIQIEEGSAVSKGDLIGYISEPTKYYTVEGANLYLKLTNNGVAVDPLDYLNYDKP